MLELVSEGVSQKTCLLMYADPVLSGSGVICAEIRLRQFTLPQPFYMARPETSLGIFDIASVTAGRAVCDYCPVCRTRKHLGTEYGCNNVA